MYRQNRRNNPDFNTGGNYMGNPDFNPGGNYMGNPDFNTGGNYMGNPDFNTGGNYKGNPDFNSSGNYKGNPDFNPGGNYKGNPDFNSGGNYMGNPDFNPGGNYKGNSDFNSGGNYKGNPDFNPGGNYKGNSDFNSGGNYRGNPDFNSGGNYKGNPDFNSGGNYKGNPDFNSGGNYKGNPDFNPGGNYKGNPDFNPGGNYKGNPDFNPGGNYKGNSDFNPGGNYKGNSDFNSGGNYRGNPDFNSGGNYKGNPDFNPGGNYMGNPDFNPGGNYKGNPDFNPGGNYKGNPDFNPGGNYKGNPDFNPGGNYKGNPDFNPGGNYKGNPDFNPGGNYKGNPDFNPGNNYKGNPGGRMDPNFEPPMFDRGHNMNYEQDQGQYNPQRNSGLRRNQDQNSQSQPNPEMPSIIRKMKMYLTDKSITIDNAAELFTSTCDVVGVAYVMKYVAPTKNRYKHQFKVRIEKMYLTTGAGGSKSKARSAAYMNALTLLKDSSIEEICGDGSRPGKSATAAKYAEAVDSVVFRADIEPDPTRPLSSLVIRENHKGANRRVKKALHVLRLSTYFCKMNMHTVETKVGNVHKVTVFVQNKPVGIGLGSSVGTALTNACGDALFNNFYRNCPIIQMYEEEYSQKWINWTNVKYLASEMENIGGHSLVPGENISNRSFVTALKKLIDSHPWSEMNSELVFGPGMSVQVAKILSNIAKERNMNLNVRKNNRFGIFYVLQRHYDPINIVNYLKKNGGVQGKYRLVDKSEIPQIQCDHWEPSSSDWNDDKASGKVPNSPDFNASKRQKMSDSFDREPMQMPWSDDRGFGRMPQPNNERFEQSRWHDNREFGPASQTNFEEPNQPMWRDRMPGNYNRETSQSNFGGMQNIEREQQFRGQMENRMSDNYGNEFNSNQNQRFGHDERRFNTMHDYGGQNFNREREFNSQFYNNNGNREQMHRTYDDNFNKPTCERDNKNYNQLMGANRRDYDDVSGVDNNRFYSQGPNYDDRRLRFNDEPQFSPMDRPMNPMNPNNMMDTDRMPNNGPWNNMQNSRNDDCGMFPPNNLGRPQGNMMMQQNRMRTNQDVQKNEVASLRFLGKKIPRTALHANVKSILANARKLSFIANARNAMGMSGGLQPRRRVRTRGKKKRPQSDSNPKATNTSQNKETEKKQSDSTKSDSNKS